MLIDQLHDFLEEQLVLYDESYREELSSFLLEITKKQWIEQIVEFAEERNFLFFQHNNVEDYVQVVPWSTVHIDTSLLVFFFEGKILMEGYDTFLRYLEKLVRVNSKHDIIHRK